jgi:hypothetical protein
VSDKWPASAVAHSFIRPVTCLVAADLQGCRRRRDATRHIPRPRRIRVMPSLRAHRSFQRRVWQVESVAHDVASGVGHWCGSGAGWVGEQVLFGSSCTAPRLRTFTNALPSRTFATTLSSRALPSRTFATTLSSRALPSRTFASFKVDGSRDLSIQSSGNELRCVKPDKIHPRSLPVAFPQAYHALAFASGLAIHKLRAGVFCFVPNR